jgi:hypothetical protein
MGPSSTGALPGQRRRDVQGLYNNALNSTIVIDQALWNNVHIEPRSGIEQSKNKKQQANYLQPELSERSPESMQQEKPTKPPTMLCKHGKNPVRKINM